MSEPTKYNVEDVELRVNGEPVVGTTPIDFSKVYVPPVSGIAKVDGYLVNFEAADGRRTYVCLGMPALMDLVERLTGREWDTLMLDERGLPNIRGKERGNLSIGHPVHVYLSFSTPSENATVPTMQNQTNSKKGSDRNGLASDLKSLEAKTESCCNLGGAT